MHFARPLLARGTVDACPTTNHTTQQHLQVPAASSCLQEDDVSVAFDLSSALLRMCAFLEGYAAVCHRPQATAKVVRLACTRMP